MVAAEASLKAIVKFFTREFGWAIFPGRGF